MKSLASVTLSLLLLTGASFYPAYAQEPPAAQKDVPVAEKPQESEVPAVEESGDDPSIDDILAGAEEDKKKEDDASKASEAGKAMPEISKGTQPAPEGQAAEADVKADTAAATPETAEKTAPVEEVKKTDEPAAEELQTAEDAKKQEEEYQKQVEAELKAKELADKQAEELAKESESPEAAVPDGLEVSEKMPAETKELEVPGEKAAAATGTGMDCVLPAGEPEIWTVPEVCNYVDIHARRIKYKDAAAQLTASLEKRRVSYEKPHFAALENYRKEIERIEGDDSQKYQKNIGKKAENTEDSTDKKPETEVTPTDAGKPADVPEGLVDVEEELTADEKKADLDPKKVEGKKPEVKVKPAKKSAETLEPEDKKASSAAEETKPEEVKVDDKTVAPEEKKVGLKEEALPPEQDEEGQVKKNKKVVMPEDAPAFDPGLIE